MRNKLISIMLAASLSGFAFGQTQSRSSHSDKNSRSDKSDKEGWVKIGEKTVNLHENHGIFDWNKDREKTINANERYSAIKFKAKDEPVNLTNVEVQYNDGQKQDVAMNNPVKVSSESKVVTLDNDKKLDKITFNFLKDESAKSKKATVEVWGLKAENSAMGGRSHDDLSMQSAKDAWVKIGEKTVDLHENHGIFNWNSDREKSVNANDRYSAIKFKAKDEPVSLTNVEVKYDNGKTQDLSINSPVRANGESKAISLQTNQKLDKITFNYKKDEAAKADKAKVEIWGLKAEGSGGMGHRDKSDNR